MLDYTKAATEKTVSDLKRVALVFTVLTQVLYILYLIYAIATDLGFMWLNIVLLSVSAAYFVLFIIFWGAKEKAKKTMKRTAAHTYKIVKLTASGFNLGVLLYSIYAFPDEVKPISIVLASLMTVVWVLQLSLEAMTIFAENRLNMLVTAMQADIEFVTKPLNTAGNVIKRLRGEEISEEDETPSRVRRMLDKRVDEKRREAERKKQEKREKLINFVFRKKSQKKDSSSLMEDVMEYSEK